MMIFTEFIQLPLFGSDLRTDGKTASRKNGAENTAAKTVTPSSDQSQSPCRAATITVPTNGTVQVKEVSENVSAIRRMPMRPPVRDDWRSTAVNQVDGKRISTTPNRLRANTIKTRAIRALMNGAGSQTVDPARAEDEGQTKADQREGQDNPDRIEKSFARLPVCG